MELNGCMSINLEQVPIGIIIDSLPENKPLYKDSGLWQVRTDNMEEVICQQEANEEFDHFIRRYFKTCDADAHMELGFKLSIDMFNKQKI
jgi:hypothetical protein